MENNEIQISFAPIELCEYNEGQIPGLPANPRTREDQKQRSLEKSIAELPEMTIARAALCYEYNGKYVVIGGNRRLEAQRALNLKMIPVILLPAETPVEKLRRIALLNNESTGQTDWHKLAKEWDIRELKGWGVELPTNFVSPEEFGVQINLPSGDKKPFQQITFTLSNDQAELVKKCIKAVKQESAFAEMESINTNQNGNALYYILKQWEEQKK